MLIAIAWEGLPSVASAGRFVCVFVGLRMSLVCRRALACPSQIRGKHRRLGAISSVRVFKEMGTASGW